MRSEPATGNGSANRRLAKTQDAIFRAALTHAGLPQPEAEYRFDLTGTRRWRFDYAWPRIFTHLEHGGVALEVEGATWARKGARKCPVCKQTPRGRHSTGAGMQADMTKYNEAAIWGWRVLRVTPDQLCTAATMAMLKRIVPTTEANMDTKNGSRRNG